MGYLQSGVILISSHENIYKYVKQILYGETNVRTMNGIYTATDVSKLLSAAK